MNILDHLKICKRHAIAIILIVVLSASAAAVYGINKDSQKFSTTVFTSIGLKTPEGPSFIENQVNEEIQAADSFSETVQGWLKNPQLIANIEEMTGSPAGISGKRQEKQNLVITYQNETREEARKTGLALKNELETQLALYNNATGSDFRFALFDVRTDEAGSKLIIFIILGLLAGLCAGTALSYAYEFVFGFSMYAVEIEDILEKKATEEFCRCFAGKCALPYLTSELKKHKTSKTVAGINFNPQKLSNKLRDTIGQKDISTIVLPHQLEELSDIKGDLVVVCKLGVTKTRELERIKEFLPGKYNLVIVY